MATRVYNASEVKADLYNRITTDGEFELLLGDASKGDIPVSLWQYDASSSASDDFANGVIKPTLQTGNGRWLRQNNFPTPSTPKRQETYSGTSDSSGAYTVTFANSFVVAPAVNPSLPNQSNTDHFYRITSVSTTGFTINVYSRTPVTVLGISLLPGNIANVVGDAIDVLVTEK